MMSALRFVWGMMFVVAVAGCSGGRESGQKVQPPPPDAQVTLEKIATTGDLSAHKDQLREELVAHGETDPVQSEELLADYEQLVTLTDAAAIKAKAQEMSGKLGSSQAAAPQ